MKAHVAVLLGALALVVASVLLIRGSRDDTDNANSPTTAAPSTEDQPSDPLQGKQDRSPEPDPLTPVDEDPGPARRPAVAENAVLVLADGRPAAGAELTWTAVAPFLLASTWDWDEIDLAWWEDSTTRATCDARGSVAPEAPELQEGHGSVVWIDLPGFQPLLVTLPPEADALPDSRYELAPAPPVRVSVVGGDGAPASNAVVMQHGIALDEPGESPAYAPLLFRRERVTDDSGACAISRFPGRQAVVASGGALRSRPIVLDPAIDRVTLRLRESFTVSGTVTRPSSAEISGEIVPRVTIGVRQGVVWRELGTSASRSDGSWGPLTIALVPGEEYRAEVHGVAVIPNTTPFPAPEAGEHVELQLGAEVGLVQWLMGYDGREDVPLPGTKAVVSWWEEGERRSISAMARPDGYVLALGIRPGPVEIVLSKPGYRAATMSTHLPLAEPRTLTAVLKPAVEVSGVVLTPEGEPARDFDLAWWTGVDTTRHVTRSYRDQPDGAFQIDSEPGLTVGIAASSTGYPGSEPVQVEVPQEGLGDVEVELVGAMRGSGRVVAADDGRPLPGAVIQAFVSGGGAPLTPYAEPVEATAGGRFVLEGCREGDNTIVVSSPGFAERTVHAKSESGKVDFGVVELQPAIDLRVVVESALQGVHFLTTRGAIQRATSDFERDEQGALVGWLRDMPAGRHLLDLRYPDGSTAFLRAEIDAGSNVVRFPGGAGSLVATLGAHGDLSLSDLEVVVDVPNGSVRRDYRIVDFDADETATMHGLPAGEVRVALRHIDEVILDSESVTIAEGEATLVELTVGEADLLLRVVDADGKAVPGTSIRLYGSAPDDPYLGGLTNEEGEYDFRSLPPGTYRAYARNPSLGLVPETEIEFGTEDAERELVLDASASLDLQVVDGDLPLAGITCRIVSDTGKDLTPPVQTNDDGRALFPKLTPGAYRLQVTSDATWPVELDLDVQPGMGPWPVEVRRLGDLHLRVVNSDGVPVSETKVSLTDGKTGTPAQEWIAGGLVDGPSELASDQHGEISLSGLPHGTYAWSTASGEGTIVVEPGEETEALVTGP